MADNIKIEIAVTKEQKKQCDLFVVQNHSYVASSRTVGRCIKYMIYEDDLFVGTFWLGSGFKPTPKNLLQKIGMSQKEFDKVFNNYADNKRFCLGKTPKNFGSKVLKQIRNRCATDWKEKYGDDLFGLVTTIGGGKNGSVYLADNWEKIGFTSGLSSDRKSVSMKWSDKETINERFVKPSGENKKLILFTDRI